MTAAVTLRRVCVRGRRRDVAAARAPLLAALDAAAWPEPPGGGVLVLRSFHLSGTARELPARAAELARRLAAAAVDGWSVGADAAEAVRFRSEADRVACLAHDVALGRAEARWPWAAACRHLPPGVPERLAVVLSERPLELPAVLERLAATPAWEALWARLDGRAAAGVARAVAAAAGWGAALRTAAADAAVPPDRSGPLAPLLPALPLPPRFPPPRELRGAPPDDGRVLLLALAAAWTSSPAALATAGGGALLRAVAAAIVAPRGDEGRPPATRPEAPGPGGLATPAPRPPAAARAMAPAAAERVEVPAAVGGALAEAPPAPRAGPRAGGAPPRDGALPAPAGGDRDRVAPAPPPPVEHDFVTARGGLLYLLGFLALPAVQRLLGAREAPGAGWRWLHRLAVRLGCAPDAALAAFLADGAGLDQAALGALPPCAWEEACLRLGADRHGAEVWTAATFAVPARVVATASHVDAQFRAGDARLAVRRGGLDVDPGWLPWLGRVVRFHYGSGLEPPPGWAP